MALKAMLFNMVREARERGRLARVPKEPCQPSALRPLDSSWLRTTFTDPAAAAEWPEVEREIGALAIPSTAGGVNPGDRRALFHLVRALKPRRVLEIGTNIGASTTHIAVGLRLNGPEGELTTVDILPVNEAAGSPWVLAGASHSPAAMMARLGMEKRAQFVVRPSLEFLADESAPFDLIFLDGDHAAATVYRELPAALRRLTPGGVVLLHDFFPGGRALWPDGGVIAGPWLATERLRREGARFEVLPLGDLPWATKQGGNRTSLALATRGS